MEVKAKTNLEKHLTANKFYRVVERTDKEFTIMNDSNIKYSYPRKAFEATAESQTKIVNPNTTVSSTFADNVKWIVNEMPGEHTLFNQIPNYNKENPSLALKVVYRKSDEVDVTPTTDQVDDTINNGGSTDYYKINPEWKDLQDIIEERGLSYSQANILKCAFTFNLGRHEGTDAIRDLNKIIYFAQRELNRLKK